MPNWSSQLFTQGAKAAGIAPDVIDNAIEYANRIIRTNPHIPIIFTLSHLAHLTEISVVHLRQIIDRRANSYRSFLMRKRAKPGQSAPARRYRTICVPERSLMTIQRWIDAEILAHVEPHSASTAYHRGSSIYKAARRHCGCKWLIKIDIHRFFESIPEHRVYEVFRGLGYPDLLSFEMARLCTREPTQFSQRWKFRRTKTYPHGIHQTQGIGFLPQGAPTSPRLANLVMTAFDDRVTKRAGNAGLTYTRYADDLIFSTTAHTFSRVDARVFVEDVYRELLDCGFEPNRTKTKIIPPRGRKIALGLLVDRETPRLTKRFRDQLETHAYYLTSSTHGPMKHSARRKFSSAIGLQNHVYGLLAHADQVDPAFASKIRERLKSVAWPI